MIKKLRIKFVAIVMVIAMLMVGGILGVVVHFTAAGMERQSLNMMRAIAARPFQLGNLGNYSGEVRLPFFTVQTGSRGEVIAVAGGYFDLSDRGYIQQIVTEALASDSESGSLKTQDLRYLKVANYLGHTVVFSDTTNENATLKQLLYICLSIFAAVMLVFLGASILLSHWAIRPMANAWEQQRQFVADASHELKTPLAVIMSNAELMQNEEAELAECKQYSKNILTTTYQMRSLVENMLEMARVDNGALKMGFAVLDLSELVSDAVLSFRLLYQEHGMGLRWAVSEGISVRGSEQHLYQVLDVLLDNALKYSAPGSVVSVELTQTGRSCTLAVKSPGEPLSGEELKHIFKRFYRADKARAMNGSYGLGLAIAESIVEAHKGKIWAETGSSGNVFLVQLPLN